MTILKIGDKAPDFLLPVADNRSISLADFKGQKLVLYFYPKDDTPGCTIEAQDFSELAGELKENGIAIIGISKDSLKSHDSFCNKYRLNLTLASDSDGSVCESYGVWVEKSMFGKKYMGIGRATFLIDSAGKIVHIWPNVSVNGHAREVLARAKAL